MAYTLINEDEPVPVKECLVVVLYGEPGCGKTSLAFTAENPLLMDYDIGVHRSVGRKKTVTFKDWNDTMQFLDDDIIKNQQIKTLIPDTAGTMLDDYLALHVLKMDAKYGNGAGGLGLKGYGIMKDGFSTFLTAASKKGIKAIFFICHTSTKGDGDNDRMVPKLTGGSYDILISKADLVGYVEMKNGVATLDFNPTTRHLGKNCAEFKAMKIPHYSDPKYSNFMGEIIKSTRDHMERMSEAQVAAVNAINNLKEEILQQPTIEALETILPNIEKMSQVYKIQAMNLYEARFVELWSTIYLKAETVNDPEDFDILASAIKELPQNLQVALRQPFINFSKSKSVKYDKVSGSYVKFDPLAEEQKTITPSMTIVKNEEGTQEGTQHTTVPAQPLPPGPKEPNTKPKPEEDGKKKVNGRKVKEATPSQSSLSLEPADKD